VDLLGVLPALLPAAAVAGACYALRPQAPAADAAAVVAPLRLAIVRAAVVVGAYAVVGVEVLSAAGALDAAGVTVLWVLGLAAAGTGVVLRYRRDGLGLRRPTLPRWSPVAWLMVVGLVAIAVLTLTVALASAPNNWDSQSYHLPKVEQWVQNRSVGLFPSPFFSQNGLAPGAEFLLLHLRLLTGGDRLYNLVQWSAAVVCGVAASRAAAQFGARLVGQIAAAFVFVAAPMVVLQSTSTQTDLVASAWVAAAATLAIDAAWNSSRLTGVLLLGTAVGLAQNTKATGVLAVWPMVAMWLAVRAWWALRARHRRDAVRLAGSAVTLVAVALVIAGPFLARMTLTYGNPLGPPVIRDHSMHRHDPPAVLLNGARLLQTAAMVPWTPVNRWTADAVERVGRAVRVDAGDPAITQGAPFPVRGYAGSDEDLAPFPLQIAAGLVALGYGLVGRRRDPPVLAYAATCLVVLLAFAGYLKWQLYVNRLLLPALVVTAPLVGLVVDALLNRARRASRVTAAAALTVVIVVAGNAAIRAIVYGKPRSLVGHQSVLRNSSWADRFARIPMAKADYDWAAATVKAAGARRVGLVIKSDNRFEYPLWVSLRGRTLVNLVSDVPGHPAPPATSVDAIICDLPGPSGCASVVPADWVIQKRQYLDVALPAKTAGGP
jgi:hypothetical protein